MTEETHGAEIDPEEIFNEGRTLGQSEQDEMLREQIADELEAQGFDDGEIEQALFSEDSDVYGVRRRHRRRHARRYRTYDSAPRRRRRSGRRRSQTYAKTTGRSRFRRYGRRTKGMLGKLKKYAAVGGFGLSFLAMYKKRAADLIAQGATNNGKPVKGVIDAIQYDLANFDMDKSMSKLQDNAGEIAFPLALGWGVRETKILDGMKPGISDLVGKVLMGAAGGILLGTALDDKPGTTSTQNSNPASRQIQQQTTVIGHNPYGA